jgi:hypothetical protein
VIEAKARADKRYWLTNCRAISASDRDHAEAKDRPLYIVERAIRFEDAPTAARRAAANAELS